MWLCAAAFAVAVALFAWAQVTMLQNDPWWGDELFTLWATAPGRTLTETWQRIGPDPTPPLYYVLLSLLRRIVDLPIEQARDETAGLNFACIAISAGIVAHSARRAGVPRLGLLTSGAFLLSGSIEAFGQEARAYSLALCVVFVTAWGVALLFLTPGGGWSWRRFALLGLLAAFIHTFAALACVGLAIGLFFAGRSGFALGFGAMAGGVLRLLVASDPHAAVALDWIPFTPATVWNVLWNLNYILVGGLLPGVVLAAVAAAGMSSRSIRKLTACFLAAMSSFLILPTLASFIKPMMVARYLLIGGPLLVVFVSALVGAARLPLLTRSGAMAFLVVSSLSGYRDAAIRLTFKAGWNGVEIVRPLVGFCAPGTIHVSGAIGNPARLGAYAVIVPLPVDRFVDATLNATLVLAARDAQCPVLGWAEGVFDRNDADFVANSTDAALLARLKISAAPDEVEVVRHAQGYVVLKRTHLEPGAA